jgi:hypothetical protein
VARTSNYKLTVLEPALREFENARSYYDSKVQGLGSDFEDTVFKLLAIINKNPNLFPVKFANIHEAVLDRFPFVINYEIYSKEIIVSAIFHVKQDPLKKLKRKRK